jgi:CHRD domain
MRRIALLSTAAVVIAGSTVVMTNERIKRDIRELLTGNEEVPIVLTAGRGLLTATINEEGTEIAYKLEYSGLEADVTQAHIHVGQPRVNGGISVWLCSNLASPPTPAGVQPCPVREGTIEGVLTSADVVGPASQGIVAGDFARLLLALRAGQTYANVHTTRSTGGEIRSQIDHNRHR